MLTVYIYMILGTLLGFSSFALNLVCYQKLLSYYV